MHNKKVAIAAVVTVGLLALSFRTVPSLQAQQSAPVAFTWSKCVNVTLGKTPEITLPQRTDADLLITDIIAPSFGERTYQVKLFCGEDVLAVVSEGESHLRAGLVVPRGKAVKAEVHGTIPESGVWVTLAGTTR